MVIFIINISIHYLVFNKQEICLYKCESSVMSLNILFYYHLKQTRAGYLYVLEAGTAYFCLENK